MPGHAGWLKDRQSHDGMEAVRQQANDCTDDADATAYVHGSWIQDGLQLRVDD